MSTPEGRIKTAIRGYLRSIGAFEFLPTQNHFSRAGVPDIICCINGRFVAIEVKTAKGKVTELQQMCIDEIRAARGVAFVARSVEDVESELNEEGLV